MIGRFFYCFRIKLCLVILLIFSGTTVHAQKKLILTRLGNKNRITFKAGDEIWLKPTGADNYVGGPIVGLRDSVIRFHYFDIKMDHISEIDISKKFLGGFNSQQYGASLLVAAPFYLFISNINNEGKVDRTSIMITTIIAATGYILLKLKRKRFRIKGRNRILIVD